uniref:Annexin n=1 Tax=Ascaris lumbricoides TaxID=6252 RepID=A0A0M3IIJ9_ASCLU
MGTNDRELITIIVQRSEVDLALIRDQYKREFNKKLVEVIRSECSDMLIDFVDGPLGCCLKVTNDSIKLTKH